MPRPLALLVLAALFSACGDPPDGNCADEATCDGVDEDCDGRTDEGLTTPFYRDADGDGHGDPAATVDACAAPTGFVAAAGDCDDTDAAVGPGGAEVCNQLEDDCDPSTPDGADEPGFGEPCDGEDGDLCAEGVVDCVAGVLTCTDDSADDEETCEGTDEDCDGLTDEGLDVPWYRDGDADGYGIAVDTLLACAAPVGYAELAGDCDDSDPSISPVMPESCDDRDQDCDGYVDEGVTTPFYADVDGDGWGDASVLACTVPAGHAPDGGDCNESDPWVHPTAPELCNGADDDCDGVIDDSVVDVPWYRDADGDGHGDPAASVTACSAPLGYVRVDTDCNDLDPDVAPTAPERCARFGQDPVDDDCDGRTDEVTECLAGDGCCPIGCAGMDLDCP